MVSQLESLAAAFIGSLGCEVGGGPIWHLQSHHLCQIFANGNKNVNYL